MDKILGLEYGADDYVTKPFNILEVKARIKAIMRRNSRKSGKGKEAENKMITAGDLKLIREGRRVFIGEKKSILTAKEFDLLELLVCNPNKVYSREPSVFCVGQQGFGIWRCTYRGCSRKTSA